jgi:hypothetical protein
MGSKGDKANSALNSDDMLEKIAAINHLTVTNVVRLLLVEALPEEGSKLGTRRFAVPLCSFLSARSLSVGPQ